MRKTPEKALESVPEPSGEERTESGQRSSLFDDYQVDESDVKGSLDALRRRGRQKDPMGEDWRTKDVRDAESGDVRARLQAEVDRRCEAFQKNKDALDSMRNGSVSSLAMLNRMFVQMSRSMGKPADRMAADMMARMMAALYVMEQERLERERREALERDLYEKRGEMWDAEKRLKAADKAIAGKQQRGAGRHVRSSIESVYGQDQRQKASDGDEMQL